ncbi:MAG TPA: phosphotransferase [Patescibacteria group bacterium]|nr:phosphotransferase [Patescibacteria group bacterium]
MPITPSVLFGPNNHSLSTVEWQDADSNLIKKYSDLLCRFWGFSRIDRIQQVKAWERMSHNFRVSGILDGRVCTVLFRKQIQLNQWDALRSLTILFSQLFSRGVPCPRILETQDHEIAIEQDGFLFQVFAFYDGQYFHGSEVELEETAKAIARLHEALKDFSPPGFAGFGILKPWDAIGWAQAKEYLKQKQAPFDKRIQTDFPLIEQAINACRGKEFSGSRQIIHADLHPQNILFLNDTCQAILDFEGLRVDYLTRDIGNACHRFVRQSIVFSGRTWHEVLPHLVSVFLHAYESVHVLSDSELLELAHGMRDELLRKLYAKLVPYVQTGDDRLLNGGEWEKMIMLLQEVPCMEQAIHAYLKTR